jgi:hypothetical protein
MKVSRENGEGDCFVEGYASASALLEYFVRSITIYTLECRNLSPCAYSTASRLSCDPYSTVTECLKTGTVELVRRLISYVTSY